MIESIVLVSVLLCLAEAQINQQEVRHLIFNDANLIETVRGFALNGPLLLQHNLKAVSINGDQVRLIAPNCQQTELTKQALMGSPAQQNLINSAKQALYAVESGVLNGATSPINRAGSIRFTLNGNSAASMYNGRNLGMSSFSTDNLSITKYDEQGMTMAKTMGGFPDNIARIFLTGDLVTYVYNDMRVLMKPMACLSAAEQQLVQQVRQEANMAQQRFDQSMHQFHQNMHGMQQRLQQNMQNLQQNIGSQFGVPYMAPLGYANNMGQFQQRPQRFNLMQQQQNQGYEPYHGQGFGISQYNSMGSGMMGSGAFAQAGSGMAAAHSGNWPFGSNNNPFGAGFPFGR